MLFGLCVLFLSYHTKYLCSDSGFHRLKILGIESLGAGDYCVSLIGISGEYISFLLLSVIISAFGAYYILFLEDKSVIEKTKYLVNDKIIPEIRKVESINIFTKKPLKSNLKTLKPRNFGLLKNYKTWKYLGLIIGVSWLIINLVSRFQGGFFTSSDFHFIVKIELIITIVVTILRVFSAITCYTFAKVGLIPYNRFLWALFGLLLPHIALVVAGVIPVKNYKTEFYK